MTEWLKTNEVAEITGLSSRTVRVMVAEGKLQGKRTGEHKQNRLRISRASVLGWLESLPDATAATAP